MQSKSSTSLAITSILAILIVFFIAISDVENSPQRKPFPTEGAKAPETTEEEKSASKIDAGNASTQDSADTANSGKTDGQDATILTGSDLKSEDDTKAPPLPASPATGTGDSKDMPKNISSESLLRAGFTNIVIKPIPFTGQIFDQFDLSVLADLDIVEKQVVRLHEGNEVQVLRAYEFNFADEQSTAEIYDFLKAKFKDSLGVTINQTNQFGLGSFYINFGEPREQAFLVVKTRNNVYALSYPKAKVNGVDYFQPVSRLLEGLL